MKTKDDLIAEWDAQTAAAPEPRCGHVWQEGVQVNLPGHPYGIIIHSCGKKVAHASEHECACKRTWPRHYL